MSFKKFCLLFIWASLDSHDSVNGNIGGIPNVTSWIASLPSLRQVDTLIQPIPPLHFLLNVSITLLKNHTVRLNLLMYFLTYCTSIVQRMCYYFNDFSRPKKRIHKIKMKKAHEKRDPGAHNNVFSAPFFFLIIFRPLRFIL